MGFLNRVESLSGRPVEFRPGSGLSLRATLQMARHGAPAHLLRYRATNEPLDYWVAYQAGYALRLFELPADERMDLCGTGETERLVDALLRTGQPLGDADRAALRRCKHIVAHWALMNLRSFPIGLRIDQWLASEYPSCASCSSQVSMPSSRRVCRSCPGGWATCRCPRRCLGQWPRARW